MGVSFCIVVGEKETWKWERDPLCAIRGRERKRKCCSLPARSIIPSELNLPESIFMQLYWNKIMHSLQLFFCGHCVLVCQNSMTGLNLARGVSGCLFGHPDYPYLLCIMQWDEKELDIQVIPNVYFWTPNSEILAKSLFREIF